MTKKTDNVKLAKLRDIRKTAREILSTAKKLGTGEDSARKLLHAVESEIRKAGGRT
jgi:hypothetical protein